MKKIVRVEHVRALCAGSQGRTVLVLGSGGPCVVTPDTAFGGIVDGRYRLLCTRADLLDDGLREGRDGQLLGPTVPVCTKKAAYLNETLLPPESSQEALPLS